MVNKFKYFFAIGILLAIAGCGRDPAPIDEELGIAINDQGKPCYTMAELNLLGSYVSPDHAKRKLLQYYKYPENYRVMSYDYEGTKIKITIVDQYNCVVYLDTLTRGEYGHHLGFVKRIDIKDN